VIESNHIAGRWVAGAGPAIIDVDPARNEPFAELTAASVEQVDAAVAAARDVAAQWRRFPAPRRAEILFRAAEIMTERKEALSIEVSREMGKVIDEGRGDVQESIDLAYFYAGEGRRLLGMTSPSESRHKLAYAVRAPIGVVAAISPFNFPFAIPALKALPALIAGNTVVLKPSSETPLMANRFVEIMQESGLPDGVLNIVHGPGESVGEALTHHPDVDLVSFTGSLSVGRGIAGHSAQEGKRLTFELGGKNCIIVLDDADLELTVRAVLWSAFGTTGQRCTSATRIIVQEGIHDEFVAALADAAEALQLGEGVDEATDVGPLVSQRAADKVAAVVEDAIESGGRAMTGGRRPDRPGAFYEPTILVDTPREARAEREEIFGPVTVIVKAVGLTEAINLANDTPYGLSAAIFTESMGSAFLAAEEVQTGLFYVNAGTIGAEAHLPSGGLKASGDGRREASVAALDAYSEWRTVYVDYSGRIQRAQIDFAAFEESDGNR